MDVEQAGKKQRYRFKPRTVEAFQWEGDADRVARLPDTHERRLTWDPATPGKVRLEMFDGTCEAFRLIPIGAWFVLDGAGGLAVFAPAAFAHHFEPAP